MTTTVEDALDLGVEFIPWGRRVEREEWRMGGHVN
jgi:hypothetical protein